MQFDQSASIFCSELQIQGYDYGQNGLYGQIDGRFKKINQAQILPHNDEERKYKKIRFKGSQKDTRQSSKKNKSKLAGVKLRDRKKKYVSNLQEHVKQLNSEINSCNIQLQQTKNKLNEAINIAQNMNNEHGNTYISLKQQALADDPDEDKINLLLDMLKYRIGASGKQRQAKINYYFKQIINTIFPGLYRYLLLIAEHNIDLFKSNQRTKTHIEWTEKLYQIMKLSQDQINQIQLFRSQLSTVKQETMKQIRKLADLKSKIQIEGQTTENILSEMRKILNPVQCAILTLFCQKYKYKPEMHIDDNLQKNKWGTKRMKLQQ